MDKFSFTFKNIYDRHNEEILLISLMSTNVFIESAFLHQTDGSVVFIMYINYILVYRVLKSGSVFKNTRNVDPLCSNMFSPFYCSNSLKRLTSPLSNLPWWNAKFATIRFDQFGFLQLSWKKSRSYTLLKIQISKKMNNVIHSKGRFVKSSDFLVKTLFYIFWNNTTWDREIEII